MSNRAQRESRVACAKEVFAEIPKTIGQNADPLKLGCRVGRALSCLQAHKSFGVRGRPSRPLLVET
ncbi:hypothetical protein [Candidatus Methylacidithermus pantelleriae]|uniref:Uncharacterized protein n=1 Tax=Candidatus Methylacidithermus pantelleriae TaxID=2744239 RepID=A0A8J2BV59_9BACT|nr:hypothetical protein [Candidatus Methylacidithermus pantelleriae]CAF0703312.1 hypothetical protein MPNT_550006 [Candidatus Methylacidithermus pantelleriae]